jgi:hypothetical protein
MCLCLVGCSLRGILDLSLESTKAATGETSGLPGTFSCDKLETGLGRGAAVPVGQTMSLFMEIWCRRSWLGLALVFLAALMLRLGRLDWPTLSNDEAFSWRLATYPLAEMCIRTAADVHPPLYYGLLRGWRFLVGDSAFGLRLLSVLCSLAVIGMAYLIVYEAGAWLGLGEENKQAPPAQKSVAGGALLAALLLALSVAQIQAARTIRMYALGCFLTAATIWLLLRAARRGQWGWWAAYGISAAALCLTHNYGGFIVFAQGLWGLGLMGHRWWKGQAVMPLLGGLSYAALLALILYGPWLPALWKQTQDVLHGYWIEAMTGEQLARMFFSWSLGVAALGQDWMWGLLLAGLGIGLTLWWSGAPGLLLLLVAAAPWLGGCGFSGLTGRPIVVERYLIFGQVAWCIYWGWVWAWLNGRLARLASAGLFLIMELQGVMGFWASLPVHRSIMEEVAAYLREHTTAEEPIWVSSVVDVNLLHFYLAQADAEPRKVRCYPASPLFAGHATALRTDELLPPPQEGSMRCWSAGAAMRVLPMDEDWQLVEEHFFGEKAYVVRCYQRIRAGPASRGLAPAAPTGTK